MLSFDRILPTAVVRGHWKGLTNVHDGRRSGDWVARIALSGGAVALLVVSLWMGWRITSPDPILAASALLAAGLVSSIGPLTGFRDRISDVSDAHQTDRDAIDETVAHVIMAALTSAAVAVILVIGTNVAPSDDPVSGWWAALAISVGYYTALTFVIATPRLYDAYTSRYQVSREISGAHRGR